MKMLEFFGVSSVEEWQCRNASAQVAYRHSPTFVSSKFNLATWLRLESRKRIGNNALNMMKLGLKARIRWQEAES